MFLMRPRPPLSTPSDTLFPYTTLVRSQVIGARARLDASMDAFRQTMTVQSQVVENVSADAHPLSDIVSRSQGADGSLQAQPATNQLLALPAKQQFQLQPLMDAPSRADPTEPPPTVQTQKHAPPNHKNFPH